MIAWGSNISNNNKKNLTYINLNVHSPLEVPDIFMPLYLHFAGASAWNAFVLLLCLLNPHSAFKVQGKLLLLHEHLPRSFELKFITAGPCGF